MDCSDASGTIGRSTEVVTPASSISSFTMSVVANAYAVLRSVRDHCESVASCKAALVHSGLSKWKFGLEGGADGGGDGGGGEGGEGGGEGGAGGNGGEGGEGGQCITQIFLYCELADEEAAVLRKSRLLELAVLCEQPPVMLAEAVVFAKVVPKAAAASRQRASSVIAEPISHELSEPVLTKNRCGGGGASGGVGGGTHRAPTSSVTPTPLHVAGLISLMWEALVAGAGGISAWVHPTG
eukprot:4746502-Prymnesium_polylepis.1